MDCLRRGSLSFERLNAWWTRWNWCNQDRNKVHIKCNALEKPHLHPGPWKNCLPWNPSLVSRRSGTADLKNLASLSVICVILGKLFNVSSIKGKYSIKAIVSLKQSKQHKVPSLGSVFMECWIAQFPPLWDHIIRGPSDKHSSGQWDQHRAPDHTVKVFAQWHL